MYDRQTGVESNGPGGFGKARVQRRREVDKGSPDATEWVKVTPPE